MVAAGGSGPNYAQRLGIGSDQIVQELGWDEDCDDDISADVEEACGGDLLDDLAVADPFDHAGTSVGRRPRRVQGRRKKLIRFRRLTPKGWPA